MKRTALASLISVVLLLTITGMQLAPIATANFMWYYELPTKPDMNPPIVTLYSPTQNLTFNSQNIILNFTVTKPETWIRRSEGKYLNGSNIYYVLGNITSVHYEVDGVESKSIPVQDISTVYLANPQQTLDFSINLTLPEGQHTLHVGVEGETYYRQSSKIENLASNTVQGASETISFSIAKEQMPEFFPTTWAVAGVASVAVICLGLWVYFRKRNHQLKS
jgi:hypothetical protein